MLLNLLKNIIYGIGTIQKQFSEGGNQMAFTTAAWVYPWDLQDEGIENVLDHLSENGIHGLNVTTIYHSGMFFLPHNPRKKMYFPQPGALYIEPSDWYRKCKIKPPISKLAPKRFWDELRNETYKRNMTLGSWTLALHNSQIGFAYPETNVVNAYGDYLPTALDPASTEVREFLLALTKDISQNYEFDHILIESLEYMPFRHGYHHEVIGVPLTPTVEFLMTLSFSDSFIRKAEEKDIDVERVRTFVKGICDKQFADPYETRESLSWEELHAAIDGEFSRYLTFRQELLTQLLREISKTIKSNSNAKVSIVDFGPLYPLGPDGTGWENGVNLKEYAPYIDEIHPTFYFSDHKIFEQKVHEYVSVLNQLDKKVTIVPAIRSILPQVSSRADLLKQLQLLKQISDGFTFYNYGFMPYQTLGWIRDAMNHLNTIQK
jgi:hypothetical protein